MIKEPKAKKKWYKRWWAITIWIILGLGIIGSFISDENTSSTTATQEIKQLPSAAELKNSVSTSFEDFAILCDRDATNLQKQDLFDKKFKNNYVTWTGEVRSISESFGSYTLQVRHCPFTLVSDIAIKMKDNQKDILLQYKEGDEITYKAKLFRLGDIIGLQANEGEVKLT